MILGYSYNIVIKAVLQCSEQCCIVGCSAHCVDSAVQCASSAVVATVWWVVQCSVHWQLGGSYDIRLLL